MQLTLLQCVHVLIVLIMSFGVDENSELLFNTVKMVYDVEFYSLTFGNNTLSVAAPSGNDKQYFQISCSQPLPQCSANSNISAAMCLNKNLITMRTFPADNNPQCSTSSKA